jgi:nucleoside-diphosphate-sugar epimerase
MVLEAILNGNAIDALNFGPDTGSLSVQEIVKTSRANWPSPTSVEFSENPQNEIIEAISLQLDSQLARSILSWDSRWGQNDSVIATIEWWDKVLNRSISPIEACRSDIEFLLST